MKIKLLALGLCLTVRVGCEIVEPRAKLVWAGIGCYLSVSRHRNP